MSNFSVTRRARTAAVVAAPLAVLALSLTAGAPDHITSMDSPTPKSSETAHAKATEEGNEPQETSGSETLSPEPGEESETGAAPTSEAAAPADAASFLKADNASYKVSKISLAGSPVDPGVFTGVQVSGDAASDDGALLTTVGLCAGTTYTVTKSGQDAYSFDSAGSANLDKCSDPAEAKVAKDLDKILGGDVQVSVDGNSVQLTGQDGTLALAVAK
jgi:hypothetical protein